MVKIAIVVGSTRPGRTAKSVAEWVLGQAANRKDSVYEILDIADYGLPLLDEPAPASDGEYTQAHTKAWASAVAPFDGFVFVTPEYNHGTSAALKNALDFLYEEWNNKAAAFVSYGHAGGTRAVEHLRLVMAELQIADVRAQVTLVREVDFESSGALRPAAHQAAAAHKLFDQVVLWAEALQRTRAKKSWLAVS